MQPTTSKELQDLSVVTVSLDWVDDHFHCRQGSTCSLQGLGSLDGIPAFLGAAAAAAAAAACLSGGDKTSGSNRLRKKGLVWVHS